MVQGEVVVEAVVQQKQRAKLTSHKNALKTKKGKSKEDLGLGRFRWHRESMGLISYLGYVCMLKVNLAG